MIQKTQGFEGKQKDTIWMMFPIKKHIETTFLSLSSHPGVHTHIHTLHHCQLGHFEVFFFSRRK